MAKPKNKIIIPAIIIGLIAVAAIIYLTQSSTKPGRLDSFTQCLGQKSAAMYGTFWCSHCQNQKRLFGSSVQYLPYVECSTPDGKGQLPVCAKKNITGYPTWIFADGTRLSGEVTFQALSEKTGCQLPP